MPAGADAVVSAGVGRLLSLLPSLKGQVVELAAATRTRLEELLLEGDLLEVSLDQTFLIHTVLQAASAPPTETLRTLIQVRSAGRAGARCSSRPGSVSAAASRTDRAGRAEAKRPRPIQGQAEEEEPPRGGRGEERAAIPGRLRVQEELPHQPLPPHPSPKGQVVSPPPPSCFKAPPEPEPLVFFVFDSDFVIKWNPGNEGSRARKTLSPNGKMQDIHP